MFCVKRKEGQWTEVTDSESGHVLRIRVYDIRPGSVQLAFDDDARNFEIRPVKEATKPA